MNFRIHQPAQGFTLIEMMMALAVFALLMAAVFGLMLSVLEGTSTLQDNQDRRDVVDSLDAYMKKQFSDMPALGTLNSYQRGDGEGLKQNGIIYGTQAQATAIDAKSQPNGYYVLRLTTFTASPVQGQTPDSRAILTSMVTEDDPTLVWTPLVTDIKTLSWRFEDVNATQWADVWVGTGKPTFIEFSMDLAGDLQPVTMDYWLPKVDPLTINIAPTQSATNAP